MSLEAHVSLFFWQIMRNTLIVFSGKAQSGKSTSAGLVRDIINEDKDKHEFPWTAATIHSFATALKDIARQYFGWNGSKEIIMRPVVGGRDISEEPVPDIGRTLLLNIGKKFREIRPTIWVDYVINNIKNDDKNAKDTLFLIDDMRFKNELNLAKTFHSCVSVRITRKEGALDLDDVSEKDLDDSTFDYYIDNDGTQEELKAKLKKLIKDIEAKYNDPACQFEQVRHGLRAAAELDTQLQGLTWN